MMIPRCGGKPFSLIANNMRMWRSVPQPVISFKRRGLSALPTISSTDGRRHESMTPSNNNMSSWHRPMMHDMVMVVPLWKKSWTLSRPSSIDVVWAAAAGMGVGIYLMTCLADPETPTNCQPSLDTTTTPSEDNPAGPQSLTSIKILDDRHPPPLYPPIHSSSSSTLPSLWQASVRALRLVRTVAFMVVDYKMAQAQEWIERQRPLPFSWKKLGPRGDLSEGPTTPARDTAAYWQEQVEQRRQALSEAQAVYASTAPHHRDLSWHDRLQAKQLEKEAVQHAALALAEAEDELEAKMQEKGGSLASRTHRKAATRLLQLCHQNGGAYVKVGQHIANLDYLVPSEYIQVLSSLFDNNPITPYEQVQQVLKEEFGVDHPDQLFDRFDPVPIASASLAQVHVAYSKVDGRKLAVKVQHAGLRGTALNDVRALVRVVRVVERLFPAFTWGWIADEMEPLLRQELDFTNEGQNAELAAQHLSLTGLPCHIPRILWQYSSPRVLTMEFEPGFKATDVKSIDEAGLDRRDVARLIASVFASQVFESGFVHCDPHPANVLLRENPRRPGTPEMVLVDHGLYRQLDDNFRRNYAVLWRSLLLADLPAIQEACARLGVQKAFTLFVALVTSRPFDEVIERSKNRSLSNNKRHRKNHRSGPKVDQRQVQDEQVARNKADRAMMRGYAQRFLKQIFDLIATLPRPMLLLLKMNDCLRHIDHSLGSPANTLLVSGRYAAHAVFHDEWTRPRPRKTSLPSIFSFWWRRLQALLEYLHVLVRIYIHQTTFWLMSVS